MSARVIDLASRRAGRRLMLPFDTDHHEFVRGVEVGLLAATLATGTREHHANLHVANVEHARRAADGYGYSVTFEGAEDGWTVATFSRNGR